MTAEEEVQTKGGLDWKMSEMLRPVSRGRTDLEYENACIVFPNSFRGIFWIILG